MYDYNISLVALRVPPELSLRGSDDVLVCLVVDAGAVDRRRT
jgi:hypothetical protein